MTPPSFMAPANRTPPRNEVDEFHTGRILREMPHAERRADLLVDRPPRFGAAPACWTGPFGRRDAGLIVAIGYLITKAMAAGVTTVNRQGEQHEIGVKTIDRYRYLN